MRVINLEQLPSVLSHLPVNPRVVVSGNFATPKALLGAFDANVPEYTLHLLNAQGTLPDRQGVTFETAFVGPGMRNHPGLRYLPSRLSMLPELIRDHLRPDVVLVHTSTRRHDTVSLGIEVNVLPMAIETAKAHGGVVIAQSNPHMPYTYGDAQIYENEIDFMVEVDEELATHESGALDDTSRRIGELIAAQIDDGSTLQLGIGGVPDAVLSALTGRRRLRVWSEMFSDGVLNLHRVGALDDDVPLTSSFIFGSRDLYDWLNLNRQVRMMRTEQTNDPAHIAKQAKMTSVNGALQVDLFDQANSSRLNGRIYSGFGGATDFVVGALHARGGQSFIALPSWHPKAGVSTIVPIITEPVTSLQHSAIATENGIARVFGRTQGEQANNIIEFAAHPKARDELRQHAHEFGLL